MRVQNWQGRQDSNLHRKVLETYMLPLHHADAELVLACGIEPHPPDSQSGHSLPSSIASILAAGQGADPYWQASKARVLAEGPAIIGTP